MLRVSTGKAFSVSRADTRTEGKDVAFIQRRADLEGLTTRVLCDVYNAFSGAQIKRFKTREEALEKAWAAVRTELHASEEPTPERAEEREALAQEVKQLRAVLAEKLTQLRALGGGRGQGQESAVVLEVLELLRRPNGASKNELTESTGAKKGYIDALLSRILTQKGYAITTQTQADSRHKRYRA